MLANSEDPDQTPRSAASDLGLHCLRMSPKWNARLIWVNVVVSLLTARTWNQDNEFAGPTRRLLFTGDCSGSTCISRRGKK